MGEGAATVPAPQPLWLPPDADHRAWGGYGDCRRRVWFTLDLPGHEPDEFRAGGAADGSARHFSSIRRTFHAVLHRLWRLCLSPGAAVSGALPGVPSATAACPIR